MKLDAGALTSRVWMGAVFLFLYLPIFTLIILSFNASPMVTSWGGWSLRWYQELVKDTEIINGFLLSLEIAFLTACSSVVLGALAAMSLHRFKRFPGRTLFAGMVNSPLVMPEVIIGLSLLLMLVSVQRLFGFPDRGIGTIWLGHTLLGMAYATVVVQSRLQEMSPSLEEAAQDLGANPVQVFLKTIIPLSIPGITSGIMMVFMPVISTFAIAELLTVNNIKLFGSTLQENIYNGMWNYGAALSLVMLLLIGITSMLGSGGVAERS